MPRTKTQNEELRGKTKQVIVDAAIRVFATIPYTEATISAVAREAGCVHSLIYHYFPNIRDLYEKAIDSITPNFKGLNKFLRDPKVNPEIKFVGFISHLTGLLKTDEMFAYYIQALVHASNVLGMGNATSIKLVQQLKDKFSTLIIKGQEQNKLIDMKADQIVLNVYYSVRGIASSIIFQKNGRASVPLPSTLYLPFLREQSGE